MQLSYNILQSLSFVWLLFFISASSIHAQIPDGSFMQNFKGIDTQGDEYELFQLLSEGYKVVIDISATWCEPCWDYHETQSLEDLHRIYGPEGTQEVFVLFIESDDSNDPSDLDGTGNYTYGDWLTDTPYPVIDHGNEIARLFEILYLPSIFTVCGDGRVYETGTLSTQAHYDYAMSLDCQPVDQDAALQKTQVVNHYCNSTVGAKVNLINAGIEPLQEVKIIMNGCDGCPLEKEWTGNLGYFESEVIVFPAVEIVQEETTLNFTLDIEDLNEANNAALSSIKVGSKSAPRTWYINFESDCFPNENSWKILDQDGEVIQSRIHFSEAETLYRDTIVLEEDGCYTFEFRDYRGDGLYGSSNGSCNTNGYFRLWTDDDLIMDIGGSSEFYIASANIWVESTVSNAEVNTLPSFKLSPNPAEEFIYLETSDRIKNAYTVQIIDVLGNSIVFLNKQEFIEKGQLQINISGLSPGLYFAVVKGDMQQQLHRFIKE